MFKLVDILFSVQTPPVPGNTLPLKVDGNCFGSSLDRYLYGERKLYAYETPTPYFGDVGEGVIAEDGLCYVSIDPVFAQCVSLEGYQVFLQSYGKDAVCIEGRYSDHFVVSGTPGLSFGWEMRAKQIDYDQLRMAEDRGQVDTATVNYGAEAASYLASITEGRITT